jgi:hypothetical protein
MITSALLKGLQNNAYMLLDKGPAPFLNRKTKRSLEFYGGGNMQHFQRTESGKCTNLPSAAPRRHRAGRLLDKRLAEPLLGAAFTAQKPILKMG